MTLNAAYRDHTIVHFHNVIDYAISKRAVYYCTLSYCDRGRPICIEALIPETHKNAPLDHVYICDPENGSRKIIFINPIFNIIKTRRKTK